MDTLVQTRSERFWNPEAYLRDQWVRKQAASLPPNARVLDAGAGASKYRPLFSHCRYESQDFCAYQGPLVKYVQPINHVCDITSIPVLDQSYDAVLCTEVFEHVTDPMAVLNEFARLLKPGGKLFLTAPQVSALHMEPYHYYGGFTHHWYRYWLPKTGFAVDSITATGGPARTAVIYLDVLYSALRNAEPRIPLVLRSASKGLRFVFKIPFHLVLPRLASWIDRRITAENRPVGPGLLVEATRMAR